MHHAGDGLSEVCLRSQHRLKRRPLCSVGWALCDAIHRVTAVRGKVLTKWMYRLQLLRLSTSSLARAIISVARLHQSV